MGIIEELGGLSMLKKILFSITLFIFCISLSVFAGAEETTLSLYLGETVNLKAYSGSHSLDIDLSHDTQFQNANAQVVEIDNNFNLHALSVGESLLVVVNKHDLTPLRIRVKSPIKSIKVEQADLTLLAGEIYPLNYELIADDGYDGPLDTHLKWQASKNNIAGVKGQDLIHTYSVGTTTLTATAYDKSTSFSINVTVVGNTNPLTVKPLLINGRVNVGEKRQLQAFFGDKDVTSHVKWTSEYPDLLLVDENGLVTPLKEGTCKVTATSSINHKKDHYTFFIKSMVDSVHLSPSKVTLNKLGEQVQLTTTLKVKDPKTNPLRKGYYFTSSNTGIASVDQNGLVTAKSPGIALISVITHDSGKKDFCTVEIPKGSVDTSIDYILTKGISLSPYTSKILIGQKILMDYKIIPENATNTGVKFHVDNGSDQIHFIDGQYFFVPTKKGHTKIKIVANNKSDEVIDDSIDVSVISPIASLDLDLTLKRGTKNERKLYIGEKTELLTEILTQGHYSSLDVYPNTLEYTVDDPDILKLDYENGQYFLTALKRGSTTIRVVDSEDKHDEFLKINVLSPVKTLSTDRGVELPVASSYTPRISYSLKSNIKENIPFHISSGLNLDVEEFYFTKDYIDKEIAYENQLIDYFKALSYNATVETSIRRHEERLKKLVALQKNAHKGYCLVKNNFIKNRFFNPYQFCTINNNTIIGNYPGKALVKVSIDKTASSDKTTLYWTENKAVFRIQETSKWTDYKALIKEHGLESILSDRSDSEKIDALIFYLSMPSLFESESSFELLDTFKNLNLKNLPSSLLYNLDAPTTKQELALIAMYLDDSKKALSALELNSILYYDVINEKVKTAIAQGYVTPSSKDYFGVNDEISYEDFIQTLKQIQSVDALPKTLESPLNHRQTLLLLSDLND